MSVNDVRDTFVRKSGVTCSKVEMTYLRGGAASQFRYFIPGRDPIVVEWDRPTDNDALADEAMKLL